MNLSCVAVNRLQVSSNQDRSSKQGSGYGSAWILIIFWKLDPDLGPHKSQNSNALEAQNKAWRAVDADNGGLQAQNGALEGL